jgi:hypothetical protein
MTEKLPNFSRSAGRDIHWKFGRHGSFWWRDPRCGKNDRKTHIKPTRQSYFQLSKLAFSG